MRLPTSRCFALLLDCRASRSISLPSPALPGVCFRSAIAPCAALSCTCRHAELRFAPRAAQHLAVGVVIDVSGRFPVGRSSLDCHSTIRGSADPPTLFIVLRGKARAAQWSRTAKLREKERAAAQRSAAGRAVAHRSTTQRSEALPPSAQCSVASHGVAATQRDVNYRSTAKRIRTSNFETERSVIQRSGG